MPMPFPSSVVIGVLYAAFLGAMVSLLLVARQHVLTTDSSVAARENWQDWLAEAKRQHNGTGPVSRRVPKSSEPPSLVLLRDHFVTSLATLVALSSALFFTMAMMVRGVFAGPSFQPDLAQDIDPANGRNVRSSQRSSRDGD